MHVLQSHSQIVAALFAISLHRTAGWTGLSENCCIIKKCWQLTDLQILKALFNKLELMVVKCYKNMSHTFKLGY